MLAALAKGTKGNLCPLWSRITLKLTFDESMKKAPLIWATFKAKIFRNGTNIIAKHYTIFLGEEIPEFFMAPKVKPQLSVLAQKIPAL